MNEEIPYDIITPPYWSNNPGDTPPFSDYSIQISVEGKEDNSALYQVHKLTLYAKCQYFNRIIHGNHCIIDLPKKATAVFPQVLDSLYTSDSKLVMTPKTAAAIAFLAGYFGIPTIAAQVTRYFEDDPLELEDCEMCYHDAKLFHNQTLENLIKKKFDEEIQIIIDTNPQMFGIFDDEFWADFLDTETVCLMTVGYLIKLLNLAEGVTRTDGAPGRLHRRCVQALEWDYKRSQEMLLPLQNKTDYQGNSILRRIALRSRAVETAREYAKEMNSNLPMRIRVIGAGISSVNGLYSRAGDFNSDAPAFVHGSNAFCLCYVVAHNDLLPQWRIVRHGSPAAVLYSTLAFTWRFSPNTISKFPPTHSWWTNLDGAADPAPTLEYEPVDGPPDDVEN